MPKFLHDRAKHILAKNPDMPESEAFAIATQQSHALGKSPKGYGTAEGRQEAREKYDEPRKHYEQKADPGGIGREQEKTGSFPSSTQLRGYVPRREAGRVGILESFGGEKDSSVGVPGRMQKLAAHMRLPSTLDQMASGFLDEMSKIANIPPANLPEPPKLTNVQPKAPSKPMSGKVPSFSKVNSDALESPATRLQPLAEPPPVRR